MYNYVWAISSKSQRHFTVNLKHLKMLAGVRNPNEGSAGATESPFRNKRTSRVLLVDNPPP
jgi:hypothetical protein